MTAPTFPVSQRYLPFLLVLFVASGCSALIYEIVWFQLLQFVIGSSAISLAVLLGTYMGGMCLGSLALPRIISARHHPLRVYALLELGIGVCGILVFFGMPYVNEVYAASTGPGYAGLLMRGAVCGVCLLPPTVLMGATLPAASRWIQTTPAGLSWLGFFYGGNIAGAVFGCLLAGFFLLRRYDAATATYVAAATNIAVAWIGLNLAFVAPHTPASAESVARDTKSTGRLAESAPAALAPPAAASVYIAIALSGMGALAAEVVWTRVLSLMLGATVYTFSIILAVFLVGLGIGSSVGAALARSTVRPRFLLGACQMLLAAAVAWSAYILTQSLPYWPIDPALSRNPWCDFQLDLVRCLWGLLPATMLWGASFPLALAAVAARGQDPGRVVGGVYAANTAGAIVGAIGSSLCLIPYLGSQVTQQLLIGVSALASLLLFVPMIWTFRPIAAIPPRDGARSLAIQIVGATSLAIAIGFAVLLAWTVPKVPDKLVAYGRTMPSLIGGPDIIYVGEGMNSWVAVSQVRGEKTRHFHVSGKVEASTLPEDMRLQRMLGHLPALVHSRPRSVLVVGCGAGVTAGTFVLHPEVERVVICEIEPLIPAVVADHFAQENYNVVRHERVELVIDDARHYIFTTPEKFDIITSDPIHPWVKGAASLYTKEYFELVKRRLNPGGVVTQWVPLYESDLETVRSEIATFFEVFPNGTIWSNNVTAGGYDIVLLGQADATRIDLDDFAQRLWRDDHKRVAQSLHEVGFDETEDLLATYAGRGADLKEWLQGAEINRDRNLRLQYLAGMGLNAPREWSTIIYLQMAKYRRFSDELFTGSEQRKQSLRARME